MYIWKKEKDKICSFGFDNLALCGHKIKLKKQNILRRYRTNIFIVEWFQSCNLLKSRLIFDRPKSVSFMCPMPVISMLSGFKSLKNSFFKIKKTMLVSIILTGLEKESLEMMTKFNLKLIILIMKKNPFLELLAKISES